MIFWVVFLIFFFKEKEKEVSLFFFCLIIHLMKAEEWISHDQKYEEVVYLSKKFLVYEWCLKLFNGP